MSAIQDWQQKKPCAEVSRKPGARGAVVSGDDQYTTFTQWWLTPCMYAEYVFSGGRAKLSQVKQFHAGQKRQICSRMECTSQ